MFEKAFQQAKDHARKLFPEEMCGFVVDGAFVPVQNQAADPAQHAEQDCSCRLCTFRISDADTLRYLPKAQMVLHSHPNGPLHPSKEDMAGQLATNIPWGLVGLDEDRIGEFICWGDGWPVAPLVGREFVHGVHDCYSLVRDTFQLGRDGLKAQGITDAWPYPPITLLDMARDDGWWNGADDFYGEHFRTVGFEIISREEARAGDCFLIKIHSDKFNHAGILISNDLIMHHLPRRVSRREPSGIWARAAERWLRYVGPK